MTESVGTVARRDASRGMEACPACGRSGSDRSFVVRERQFGTLEAFTYLECGGCGSLRIESVPADLERHYPDGYYSLARPSAAPAGLRGWLSRQRRFHSLTGRGWAGRLAEAWAPTGQAALHPWLRLAEVGPSTRFLDVGCGKGRLLRDLARLGYRHLTGVDPLIDERSERDGSVRIVRGTAEDVDGPFDFVLFDHVLEHVPDPRATLERACELLAPGGHCLVRTPVVPCEAWERYGEFWFQLDAPRHLVVHSRDGLVELAREVGLDLVETRDDSTENQFLVSELYREGLPIAAGAERFSRRTRRRYRKRAERLNRAGRGDQAAFLFRRDPSEVP